MTAHPWSLVYEGFDPAEEGRRETLCTVGNGYFATRGAAPESTAGAVHYPGTYVAGLYNRLESEVAGRTVEDESMVNVPNWLVLEFRIAGGSWFEVATTELLEYTQTLDIRAAVLERDLRFRDDAGRVTRVHQQRLVHLAEPHLAALATTFTAENWSGALELRSAIDGRVQTCGVERYRPLASDHLRPLDEWHVDEETIGLMVETSQSRVRIAEVARTRVTEGGRVLRPERRTDHEPGRISQTLTVELTAARPLTVEKVFSLYTSRDRAISEAGVEARTAVARAPEFGDLLASHAHAWEHLWRRFHLTINDGSDAEQVLNLHILHLLQTVSPNTIDLDVGVPARGLHGEAYKGHIFWDELFIFPFLTLHMPELTRSLMGYRYRRLPAARWAARAAGFRGAMFPWQSGSNGREETDAFYLNPRSGRWIADHTHLQRHVGSAVAYNAWKYYQTTGDIEWLDEFGAVLVIEVARFWASIAEYNPDRQRYEIRGVMGPDEFHDGYPDRAEPGIDNNSYTNLMAVWVICRALDCLGLLSPNRLAELRERHGITDAEVDRMVDVSRRMRVVFHEDGLISQFEGYEQLAEFDWEGYRERYGNIQRLDLIMEAEGISPNGYKLSKQADVLMLFYLFSSDELSDLLERLGYPFDPAHIPATIDYYLARSSEGSTLSRVVNSWVLSRSSRERSWRWFREALGSDIADIQGGTTPEGIHLGAMAGTVDIVQRCYTGIDAHGDVLWLNPRLPDGLQRLQLDIRYRDQLLRISVRDQELHVETDPSARASVRIGLLDRVEVLAPGQRLSQKIAPAAEPIPAGARVAMRRRPGRSRG